MSGLSTHILDTSLGQPASGVTIKLYQLDGSERTLITETVTNNDGRTDEALLTADKMAMGTYQLVFEMEAYFKRTQPSLPSPLFLSTIPVQFAIPAPQSHYHIPLLVSPYSYSTYRGS